MSGPYRENAMGEKTEAQRMAEKAQRVRDENIASAKQYVRTEIARAADAGMRSTWFYPDQNVPGYAVEPVQEYLRSLGFIAEWHMGVLRVEW